MFSLEINLLGHDSTNTSHQNGVDVQCKEQYIKKKGTAGGSFACVYPDHGNQKMQIYYEQKTDHSML